MFSKLLSRICLFACVALVNAGCVWNHVSYNKNAKWVSNVWEGDILEHKGEVPCNGSVTVHRDHGMFHLFTPEGPSWRHQDFYGFYFKKTADSSRDFYFTIDSNETPAGQLPLKIVESRGVVSVDARHVLIDVEYMDATGRWRKPPINGRRKIDLILPDDIRRARSQETK
jgi:hypothetical protein